MRGHRVVDDELPVGVGRTNRQKHTVIKEIIGTDGKVKKRVLKRRGGKPTYSPQRKINAFNFPFTGNAGSGCQFQCNYCYLQGWFFRRHVTLSHGREVNAVPDFAEQTEKFLRGNEKMPQYMKRIQWGVSTEMWLKDTMEIWKPEASLQRFQKHGGKWMLHMVTKSPEILKYKSLLAEMKERVQVEVSFVTLDENNSRIFETGTPSVKQRLRIIEDFSEAGIFVRMMMMPCMRQYELDIVKGGQEIVFQHEATGEKAPGKKKVTEKDGNAEGDKVGLKLWRKGRWEQLPFAESLHWKAVVIKDWSKLEEAQREWRMSGAKAYKQKDLNYYFVDELLRAHKEKRPPEAQRARVEVPSSECLVHSGESVLGAKGESKTVAVEGWHLPKKRWGARATKPPLVERNVMDYGYSLHSKIDWIDCI